MENTIPTAEELFKTEYSIIDNEYPEMAFHIRRKVIEFTKLHVEAALDEASKKADMKHVRNTNDYEIDTDSILNAYPLTNIK